MTVSFSIILLTALLQATPSEIIREDSLRKTLTRIADDSFEGRRTGSPGIAKARAYIIEQCREAGLAPAGKTFDLFWGTASNIAAFLPGKNRDEIVLVCAHYDHLGKAYDSRKKVGEDDIFNGADDNGSGTTALLFLGKALKQINPARERSVLLLWTSGEEQGRNGAKSFCMDPPVPLSKIVAVVNIDMIGRKTETGIQLFGVSYSPAFRPSAESALKQVPDAGVQLVNGRGNIYHRTDAIVFYSRNIPAVFLHSGIHSDYHRVTDHADRIHYGQLARLTRYIYHLVLGLTNHPEKIEFKR